MRVAVLGHGSIGRRHAGILRDLDCEVVTFDPIAPGDAATDEAALADADAAVIASPSSEHERQALLALRAGVPVLVEKPLALDSAGAARIAELCSQTNGVLDVAMNLRHHPGVLAVRSLIPDIGRIVRASAWCGSWLPGWRPGTDYRASYSAQRALGGGVLLDAIHEIDYVLWLLGPAHRAAGMTTHASTLDLDVEDVATVNLEHVSGALSSITLDYVDRSYHRGCRVVGEEGSVDWDWARGTARLHKADGSVDERPFDSDVGPTYETQMRRFLAVARGEVAPLVGVRDARATLEVVDAVRRDHVSLRPAGPQDRDRVLEWRNDPVVRAASRTNGEIAAEDHAMWFASRLADSRSRIFIIEHGGSPAGQVRVEALDDGRGEIHVALSAGARNRGLAAQALDDASRRAAHELELQAIVANVRATNIASLRAFARAGFKEQSWSDNWVTLAWTPHQAAG